jgi:hypothetical protein
VKKDLENMADAVPRPVDTETRAITTVPVTTTVNADLLSVLHLCAHVFREFPEEFKPETWAHVRHTALTAIDEAIARAEGRP